jgi:hypothetical protein
VASTSDAVAPLFNTGEMNPREIPEENMRAMMKVNKSLAKY